MIRKRHSFLWRSFTTTRSKGSVNRSYELGVRAINALIKEGKSVLLRTVSDKSKEIDPDGVGIHQNTIRKNQDLNNHFLKHRTTKVNKPRKRSYKPLDDDLDAFQAHKTGAWRGSSQTALYAVNLAGIGWFADSDGTVYRISESALVKNEFEKFK